MADDNLLSFSLLLFQTKFEKKRQNQNYETGMSGGISILKTTFFFKLTQIFRSFTCVTIHKQL